MKTVFVHPRDVQRRWYIADADGAPLGRLAARVASVLRGKHRPYFAPHQDLGDRVVVINAAKVAVSGNKRKDKRYYRHSGYPGALRSESFEHVIARKPVFPVEQAIRGMLPKGTLGRELFRNLRVYPGAEHPHEGQHPQPLDTITTEGITTDGRHR